MGVCVCVCVHINVQSTADTTHVSATLLTNCSLLRSNLARYISEFSGLGSTGCFLILLFHCLVVGSVL